MADKKLNDLAQIPSIGNLKNIYVEDANGNQYKVSKESLAEVLGGLIGVATPEKSGLMNSSQALRSISKSNNLYLRLKFGIKNAGENLFGFLCFVDTSSRCSMILVSASIWNNSYVYCKLINGEKGAIRSLSYTIDADSTSLYLDANIYGNSIFIPFTVSYSSSLEVVSSIPSNAVAIEFW